MPDRENGVSLFPLLLVLAAVAFAGGYGLLAWTKRPVETEEDYPHSAEPVEAPSARPTASARQPGDTPVTPLVVGRAGDAPVRTPVTVPPPAERPTPPPVFKPAGREMAPDQLFARASPAVVRVVVRDNTGRAYGSGSGFVIGQGGMIATNYHVVEGASVAEVLFADGRKAQCSVAVAVDEAADLVLLQPSPRVVVTPLELAGDPPPVGTKVYAIGSPLGLSNTLSDGLVSGHRQLNGTPVIQTSAPISPGSSGGPLLAADGRVVGVTTAGVRDGQNLNFAVTAGHVRRLVKTADSGGLVARFPLPRRAPPAKR